MNKAGRSWGSCQACDPIKRPVELLGEPCNRGWRALPPLPSHHLRICTWLIPLPDRQENNGTKAAVRTNYTLRRTSGIRLHKADRLGVIGGKTAVGKAFQERGAWKGMLCGFVAHPPARCHCCCKAPNGLSL